MKEFSLKGNLYLLTYMMDLMSFNVLSPWRVFKFLRLLNYLVLVLHVIMMWALKMSSFSSMCLNSQIIAIMFTESLWDAFNTWRFYFPSISTYEMDSDIYAWQCCLNFALPFTETLGIARHERRQWKQGNVQRVHGSLCQKVSLQKILFQELTMQQLNPQYKDVRHDGTFCWEQADRQNMWATTAQHTPLVPTST